MRVRVGTIREAPPWVLLHGASGSWRTFNELLNSTALPGDRDIVVIDLPGWGDSPGRLPFTIEEQGKAVAEVLHVLNYRSWCLFGHSMGGVLSLEIATSAPRQTLAVVVLSPTALTAAAALSHPSRHLSMAPLVGMFCLMLFLRTARSAAPKLLQFARQTGLLRLILGPFFAHPSRIPARAFSDLALDARPASFIAAAEALKNYDVGKWRSITCRTVLARGSHDIFTPAAELHKLSALIPHAQLANLAETGHFAHVEDADATLRLLADLFPVTQPLDSFD